MITTNVLSKFFLLYLGMSYKYGFLCQQKTIERIKRTIELISLLFTYVNKLEGNYEGRGDFSTERWGEGDAHAQGRGEFSKREGKDAGVGEGRL